MSLSHSILASLIGGSPCSGYDLAKKFNSTVGFFWKATHQQIYRELSKLEDKGFVKSEVVKQNERPDKKIYIVTDIGQDELKNWLVKPSNPTPIKEELMVKMHVGYLIPRDVLLNDLEQSKQIHVNNLKLYRQKEEKYFKDTSNLSGKNLFRYLTLRGGINHEISQIAWFDEAIIVLKKQK